MGPSGAGKTTMLNMLTLDPGSGNATGFLTLNGHPLTPALYAQHCAYVTQQDLLWTFLTCREHLRMALDLYRPSLSAKERETAIDDLLDSTGLMSCQHTKAGNMFFRGLSGGQKRRLSLAIALAKRPSVIFLDEPTSGLDSAASAKIMKFMKEIAMQANIAIVCTIHQPSASVFEGFDDTLILSGGHIAYFGPAAQLAQHLKGVGRELPANANPAEYALDVVNADFTSPGSVKEVLDAWPKYAPTQQRRTPRPLAPRPQQATFCGQTLTLLKRHAVLTVREPVLYVARIVMIFATTLFFSIVWIKTRELTQDQALPKFFLMAFCVGVPALFTMIAVYGLNVEFTAVQKEIKDGMYSPNAYVLANLAIQLPMIFVLAVAALLPPWAIDALPWVTFPSAVLVFGVILFALECVAQAMSLVGNPLLGMMLFITHWFVTFLFSGLFVKISSVIWPLRILCYITPMRWGMPSMIYQAFSPYDGERGDVFEGAGKCTPSPFFGPLFCYGGFFCEGISPLECYGRTGKDILGTVGINFDVISDEFTMWTDIAYMVAIAVCWKLLFVVQLNRLCSGGTAPSAPAAKKKPPRKGDKAAVDGPVREVEPAAAAQGTGLSSQATDASELGFDPLATADVEVGDIDQMRQMRMTSVAAVPLQSQPTVSLQDFANRGSREAARKLRSGGEQTELAFIECSYTLTIAPKSRWAKFVPLPAAERCCGAKATEKRLVSNVSASVSAGHVLAVMGPSGAGKTTMLNMLTLDPGSGNATGFLTLNGHPLTPALYAQHCAYVTQQDLLWTFLTCREHLRMALDLYRPSLSAKERETAIDDLLDSTGLMSCQHTKAGNMFFRGLSGGQKRRLSLAIALAKRPSVIFLDEPTSGLDSAASAKIMKFMKEIAMQANIAIVCTIHQPSASVFEGFDDTLILSGGHIAYFGPAAQLAQHLKGVGRELPANANPAEYALDVVNADFTSKASVLEVLDAWPKHAPPVFLREPQQLGERGAVSGFVGQVLLLFKRHAVLTVREPMLYTARMVVIFAVTVFFCVVYLESRQLTQVQIMQKAFYVFWFVCVPVAFPVIAVYALNAEFVTVKKEVKDGMYGPMAYALANGLLQLPMMFAFGLCAMLPTYLILGWPWDTFLTTLALFSAHCWAFECIAQFFSLSANPLVGMLKYLNVWFISALFSGLVFRGRDVIWPLRLLYYCLPMKWFFGATAYSIMASSPPYEGTLACNSTGAGAVSYCPDEGFYCPSTEEDPFGLSCYGETGPQILDSLSKTYDAISSENTVLTDLIAILAIGVFFKVNYCVYLYASCTAGRMPNPPRQIKI